jgi:2-desacetyl-2-hydroxyethyl bacteriochlorophyllide A dehydrogenase
MKIMTYTGPYQLHLSEVDDFSIKEEEVRIETLFSGISHGTEMNVYRGKAPFFRRKLDGSIRLFRPADENEVWTYPIRSCDPGVWYMGYANVGRVVEVGAKVESIQIGDVVFTMGSHQSQIIKKETEVIKIPESVKPEYAVFFANLLTTFNGILDAEIKLGDTVVVSGLGVLGQLLVQLSRLSGAFQVYGVEIFERRAEIAVQNGADHVFNPVQGTDIAFEIRKRTDGRGADITFEVSGNDKALNEAIRIAAPDTSVIALGWYQGFCSNLDLSEEFHHNRINVKCSQAGSVNVKFRHMWDLARKKNAALQLLLSLQLENLITHRIPYDQVAEAYEMINQNPRDVVQVVLTY